MQQNSFVTRIRSAGSDIGFHWSDKAINGRNQATAKESSINLDSQHIVDNIYLFQDIKLSKVIQYYGQPAYVIAFKQLNPERANPETYPLYLVNLIYPNYGLVVSSEMYHKYDIDGNLIVTPTFVRFGLDAAKAFIKENKLPCYPVKDLRTLIFTAVKELKLVRPY